MGIFDKIFGKGKKPQKELSEEKKLGKEEERMEISFHCAECGQRYTLGRDAQVATSLGIMADAGAFTVFGDGSSFVDNPDDPDYVAPVSWSKLTLEGVRRQQEEINRLVPLLATGRPRWWKCKNCGKVQTYELIGTTTTKLKKDQESKGIQTLVELCTPNSGILFPDEYIDQAIKDFMKEGISGSRALADLINELLACRSKGIKYALVVAQEVAAVPELIEAVRSVASAAETTDAPTYCRFTPEIVGIGKVGWTTGTYYDIKELARDTLDILSGVKTKEEIRAGKQAKKEDVDELIKSLDDENPLVRYRAAGALGRMGKPKSVEALIHALGDINPAVRRGTAEALGEIGDARAVEPLIKALRDEGGGVMEAAKKALEKIKAKKS